MTYLKTERKKVGKGGKRRGERGEKKIPSSRI
jgi:hypothetical protein